MTYGVHRLRTGFQMSLGTLADLRRLVAAFRDERDWAQFHEPKDLAISISIEAAELLEVFQWQAPEAISSLLSNTDGRDRVSQEMADVLIYLVALADRLDIDLYQAAIEKLRLNADKYPVDKSRGRATKYSGL